MSKVENTKKIPQNPRVVVNPETHARLVKITNKKGMKLQRFVDDLINNALDLLEHTEKRLI